MESINKEINSQKIITKTSKRRKEEKNVKNKLRVRFEFYYTQKKKKERKKLVSL